MREQKWRQQTRQIISAVDTTCHRQYWK